MIFKTKGNCCRPEKKESSLSLRRGRANKREEEEEKDEEALVVVMMEAAICILGRGRNGDGKPLSLSNTS